MYSINGVPLDNPGLGWAMLAPSVPLSALRQNRTSIARAGRDGEIATPSTRGPVSLKFTVRTPKANLGSLLALFSEPVLEVRELADPGKVALAALASSTPELHFPRPDLYSHSFIVEIAEGCWRGSESTTGLFVAAPAGVTASAFAGLSAPVQDAVVRLKGPLQDPQVLNSSGAFFALTGSILAGEYLRFDSSTGRAWVTTADTWSGGDEVSGLVDFGGPRGVFEITPKFTDPAVRAGSLTLSQASFNTGAGFQVRGRSAYLL